jgi:hypothetical protein
MKHSNPLTRKATWTPYTVPTPWSTQSFGRIRAQRTRVMNSVPMLRNAQFFEQYAHVRHGVH